MKMIRISDKAHQLLRIKAAKLGVTMQDYIELIIQDKCKQ